MNKPLISDPSFRELNIPLPPQARKELERKVTKYEILPPIVTWDNYILTGFDVYDLCLKHHRIYFAKGLFFARKSDACAWICRQQLQRKDLNSAASAWLLSRLYAAMKKEEDRKAAKESFQYRQLAPSRNFEKYTQPSEESSVTYAQLSREFNYHKETIRKHVHFGKQLDRLEEQFPGSRILFLTGALTIPIRNIDEILSLPRDVLEELIHNPQSNRIRMPREYRSGTADQKPKRKKENIQLNLNIKQMPVHNPDTEINGMIYTISAWSRSIRQMCENQDIRSANAETKDRLNQTIQHLTKESQSLQQLLEVYTHD